jgi:hypothetical protein
MKSLKILITNNTLATPAGTEMYVHDLAIALLKRGHKPIAYSTILGEVANKLRNATVPVVNDLNMITEIPDIIHGHHHLDTMTALLHFQKTPAIYFCHGWLPWEENPLNFPRILRYIAVDEVCRDRLIYEGNVNKEKIHVLLNFVDLQRFQPRTSLPSKPTQALIFSNQTTKEQLNLIQEVCSELNIQLDIIGFHSGNSCSTPEIVLRKYDLVFAKARAALEAMAVGNAVMLYDANKFGEMVTSANMKELRRLNFGIRMLQQPLKKETIKQQILNYDPNDAAKVSTYIREDAGLDTVVDQLITYYHGVIEEYDRNYHASFDLEGKFTATYLKSLKQVLSERYQFYSQWHLCQQKLEQIENELATLKNSKSEKRNIKLFKKLFN